MCFSGWSTAFKLAPYQPLSDALPELLSYYGYGLIMTGHSKQGVSRISVSLPEQLLREMDTMVEQRGFESRSQALASMIHQQLTEHRCEFGDDIMAGTINLVYDHSTPGLQKQLADLQHQYVNEVISSLHVHLMHAKTMEVILVQGPAVKLKRIAEKLESCRGVIFGKLQMSAALLPPVHPLPMPQATGSQT